MLSINKNDSITPDGVLIKLLIEKRKLEFLSYDCNVNNNKLP